jgi:hypothetical protein
MPQPATPAAGQPGYYPDSQGVMRWWTGRDWAPNPQPPGTGQPEPSKGNWIQRNVGWKLGVLIAILGLASCGAILNGLSSPPDQTAQSTAETSPIGDEEAPEASEPEPEASGPPTYEIGEKATDDSYQFTVTKIRCGVSRIGSSDWGEKAQGQFCLVSLKVKNVGKEPIDFSDENQALFDTKGREYSADDGAWLYLEDNEILPEINPGNAIKTTVPFDIPKKAKPDYLLLKAGFWGASDGVKVQV